MKPSEWVALIYATRTIRADLSEKLQIASAISCLYSRTTSTPTRLKRFGAEVLYGTDGVRLLRRGRYSDGMGSEPPSAGLAERIEEIEREVFGDERSDPSTPHAYRVPDGETLAHFRTRLGLTQTEVAERAGVSKTTVREVERGRTNPSETTLRALLATYREAWEAQGGEGDV